MINGKSVRDIPDIYIDYILCKHFGWTPNQLDEQDTNKIDYFIKIINIINDVEQKELKKIKKIRK